MTGRSLVGRLLRNSVLANRLEDPGIIPFGGRLVLEAVAELVAASGDEGVYRPDPEIDAGRSLVQVVTRRARAVGAESVVGELLAALIRGGLVLLTDAGALALPVPERRGKPAGERKSESNRRNSLYSTGPRPDGLSDAEWAEVKAERRRHVEARLRAQGNLVLPIAGGRSQTAEAKSQIGSQSQSHLRPVSEANGGADLALPVASRAGGLLESAAAAVEEVQGESAAAAAVPPARGKPNLASAEAKSEANGLAFGEAKSEANGLAFGEAKANVSAEAAGLSVLARSWFSGWSPQQQDAAPAAFDRLLGLGYSVEAIRTVMDAKRGAACSGPGFFHKPLRARFPDVEAPAAPIASSPEPTGGYAVELHPDVAQAAEWAGVGLAVRSGISRVRRALEDPVEGERRRRLDAVYSFDRPAFLLAAKRWPEVWEILGREPEEADAAA